MNGASVTDGTKYPGIFALLATPLGLFVALLLLACGSDDGDGPALIITTAEPYSTSEPFIRAVEGTPTPTPSPTATLEPTSTSTSTPEPVIEPEPVPAFEPEPTFEPEPAPFIEPTQVPALPPTEVIPAPEPTATPVPQAPAPPPATGNHGIVLQGGPEFVGWIEAALGLLQTRAPAWYNQVVGSIDVIQHVGAGTGINPFTRVMLAGNDSLWPPTWSSEQQLVWFAGTLVHESCHVDRMERGMEWRGRNGELSCLQDQKAALLLIEDGNEFSSYVQSLIDGVDDPSNQYWTVPNRHW